VNERTTKAALDIAKLLCAREHHLTIAIDDLDYYPASDLLVRVQDLLAEYQRAEAIAIADAPPKKARGRRVVPVSERRPRKQKKKSKPKKPKSHPWRPRLTGKDKRET
jgi:hypothetical protein